ncbi:MAG: ribokinase [Oscillospiraceae bacterium]|jgi:ribokinase|nr:ribokinase [Oscillospiraceae bacterium]
MNPIFILGSTAVDVTTNLSRGRVTTSLGGKGSNQAIAAIRAGAEDVRLATKIGVDAFGKFALDFWESEGLSTKLCAVSSEYPTGVSVVLLDENGDNRIIRCESASRRMTDEDFAKFAAGLPERGIFMTQLSSTVSVALKMIRLAKERGLTVILDPAPVTAVPEDIWRYVDIITPNEAESAELGDVPVRNKLVTLGGKGVYVTDGVREEYIPAFKINVADTTGAGDAFNGAVAVALAEGADLFGAAGRGNAAGALCASRKGAALAAPYRAEIESLLKKGDYK